MASQIGVPPNTLSRWENRSTVPDANSLARDNGLTPNFFGIRKDTKPRQKIRDRLLVMWDFWTLGLTEYQVEEAEKWIKAELRKRFHNMSIEIFKTFSHPSQSNATNKLMELGWRVWENNSGMDDELIDQARSDAGQDPQATILVLITRDNVFGDLIEELHKKGVRIYLIAPNNVVADLTDKVGKKRWIEWENVNFYATFPIWRK